VTVLAIRSHNLMKSYMYKERGINNYNGKKKQKTEA
jgi:hypothetical protein